MVFLHINRTTVDSSKGLNPIDRLNKFIHTNKNVFALIYMEGCGPCNATRPEWAKLKNVLKKYENDDNIIIVDIDKDFLNRVKYIKTQPVGFPTIRYITNRGNTVEDYEDSKIDTKDRTVDSFVDWINYKINENTKEGEKGGTSNKKGGMLIDTKDSNSFNEFIENSTFKILSRGANGITFVATTNTSYTSKYSYLNSYKYGDPVTKLLIKITFINDSNDYSILISPREFNTTKSELFKNEVNIQTDIFLKSMNYLQPICPAIVYADCLTDEPSIKHILSVIKKYTTDSKTSFICNEIYKNYGYNNFEKLGIIGMEFADNYQTLFNLKNSDKFELYKDMSLYLLLRLAIETGYTHGDFHPGNIMINTTYNNYFKNIMGAPFLIDFGYAQKIPLDILNIIKENYKKKFYTTALKELCNIKRTDNLSMNDYKDFYGWACGQYDYKKQQPMTEFKNSTNEVIKILFKRREDAIDNTITLFDQKHSTDPKYPLLPLSNAVKNKMFSGLIGGKKKTKNYTRKNNKKGGKWSLKYKRSINCRRPKGFSQRQYCKYSRRK